MGVKDQTVEAYLASVAAGTPTPGGGSVSALVGALAVALTRMVGGLAVGKKGYEGSQEPLRGLEERAESVQRRLVALADEDSAAYDRVVEAMHLPKTTDAERAARVAALQAAYRHATEVPLETVERCVEALELARQAAEHGNRGASTYCGVAVLLAEASIRGASLNVRVNLASLKDEAYRALAEARLEAELAQAQTIGHEAMALVEGRI
ncbi:MAG TPA: cyclodeaminase/cyclohydrolase family protein [Thermoplasmata archaeon]|nr:cyclodeaminase/cyclohydrolase family protein [Thermoplasmata archaeon]